MQLPADFDQRIATMSPVQRVRYVKALHQAAQAVKTRTEPPPRPSAYPEPTPRPRINEAEADRVWLQRQNAWLEQPDVSVILFGTDNQPPMVIPPAPPASDRELVFLPMVLQRMERLQAHIVAVWERKRNAGALGSLRP